MTLPEVPLFQDISKEELFTLLPCLDAAERSYKRGQVILSEGEPTQWMGVVLQGLVILSCPDIWGKNTILGSAGPGSVFAEAYACVPGEPLMIRVSAAEDSRVLMLNLQKFLSGCGSCPCHAQLVRNLLRVCAGKSLQLSRRILHTSPKSIRGRLESYFSECVKKSGSLSFTIPFNRQQLADYLGVDRSAMSSELSRMRREGRILVERNRFTMLPGTHPDE